MCKNPDNFNTLIIITMLLEMNAPEAQKPTKMKKNDLEKTVGNAIRAEILADIRERMPRNFFGLYYDTLSNVSSKFYWYDKHLLRHEVVIAILENFPKRLTEDDSQKLKAILERASQELNESNMERRIYNRGNGNYI